MKTIARTMALARPGLQGNNLLMGGFALGALSGFFLGGHWVSLVANASQPELLALLGGSGLSGLVVWRILTTEIK